MLSGKKDGPKRPVVKRKIGKQPVMLRRDRACFELYDHLNMPDDHLMNGRISSTAFIARRPSEFVGFFRMAPFSFGHDVEPRLMDAKLRIMIIEGQGHDVCGMPKSHLDFECEEICEDWCSMEDFYVFFQEAFERFLEPGQIIFTGIRYDGLDLVETRITVNGHAKNLAVVFNRRRMVLEKDSSIRIVCQDPIALTPESMYRQTSDSKVVPFPAGLGRAANQ